MNYKYALVNVVYDGTHIYVVDNFNRRFNLEFADWNGTGEDLFCCLAESNISNVFSNYIYKHFAKLVNSYYEFVSLSIREEDEFSRRERLLNIQKMIDYFESIKNSKEL